MPNLAKIESLENKIRHFHLSNSIYERYTGYKYFILKYFQSVYTNILLSELLYPRSRNVNFFAKTDGNSPYRSFLIIKINDFSCSNIDLIKRYCFPLYRNQRQEMVKNENRSLTFLI